MDKEVQKKVSDPQFHQHWAHLYDWVYEKSFGASYKMMTEASIRHIQRLVGLVQSEKPRIADIGAGTGRLTKPLIELGFEIVAVEPSSQMLERLKLKVSGFENKVEVINTSMADFKARPVDISVCVFTVFAYITEEDELQKSIRNIAHHIKPSGYFLFDLASDLFFQGGVVMSHSSPELHRETRITPEAGEVFRISDDIYGQYDGVAFQHNESFLVRRWDKETFFHLLEESGMKQVDFDDSDFRFTGSRYFLFQKGASI